jgi:hypothetical protein
VSRELSELLAEAEEEEEAGVTAAEAGAGAGAGAKERLQVWNPHTVRSRSFPAPSAAMRLPSCHLLCRLKAEEEGEVEAVEHVAVEEEAGAEVEAGISGGKQPNPTVAFDGLSYRHVAAMRA